MKTFNKLLALILITTILIACKQERNPEVKTVDIGKIVIPTKKELNPNAHYAKVEFTINGMTCAIGCARTIEKKIANMDGVKSATIDFDKKLAMVEYDDAVVNTASLEETVSKVADIYKVIDMKTVEAFSTKK